MLKNDIFGRIGIDYCTLGGQNKYLSRIGLNKKFDFAIGIRNLHGAEGISGIMSKVLPRLYY